MARTAGRTPRRRPALRRQLRHLLPFAVGLAAIVALVASVQPATLASALRRFDVRLLPALAALSTAYYLLQGLRWRRLLEAEGVHMTRGDATLLNLAGQSTAMLPLGELTRAVFVSEATGASFGTVTATVTVQELSYSAVLIAIAVPGSLDRVAAAIGVVSALVGIVAVIAILTVPAVFRRVLRICTHIPVLRDMVPAIEELQVATVDLLRNRVTYTTSWMSLLQAGASITLLWTAAQGLAPGSLGWLQAAFVYAVVNVGSAISLSPGGLGAFELGGAGLLVAVGVPYDVAAATMLVHRTADKGLATLAGFVAYWFARRRWGLRDISLTGLGARRDPDHQPERRVEPAPLTPR